MANSFYFVIWATLFRAFGQQFTEKMSKPFSKCSDNILWKQIFSNLSSFLCIILLWAQIFWDLAEIFPQSDKAFYGSRRRLWWKTLFLINSPFFGSWSKLFLTFGKNFWEKLSKLFSTCSWNILTKKIHWFFCFWYIFGLWAKISLHLTKNIP